MRRAATTLALAAVAAGAFPATAPARELRVGHAVVVVVNERGQTLATIRVATATLRVKSGRRLRVTLQRRGIIDVSGPFSPPRDPAPEESLVDIPLPALIWKEPAR